MVSPWNQAVEELAEWMRLSRNVVVPFVGAGVSRAANLPTWRGLAETIIDTVDGFNLASNKDIVEIKTTSPLEALTFCRGKLGDEMFRRQVSSVLTIPQDFIPPEVARLCWLVNDQLTVTTNLDDVLERAAPLVDKVPAQALTPKDALSSALIAPGRRVLHLHGILSRFDTWVMTASDYENATAVESPTAAALQSLLLNKVVLFLGYSCNDQDLNLFLDRFRDHFPQGSTMHFALMSTLSDDERRRLLDYGIFPVEYTPSTTAHPELTQFLEAVLTKYDPMRAEALADERSRQAANVSLLPLSELRGMSFGSRRDRLNQEFGTLFEQASNYALTDSSELPPAVKHRRAETIELLAGAWQVDTMPPMNAIDGREVIADIGRGGFGIVYEVQDVHTNEKQALKVAHFQETSNYKFVQRFKQGIWAMRRLTNHGVKNTTKYLGHREVPLCVFMEHVDGGDLGALIKNVPLGVEIKLQLAQEIADIVAEAHQIPVYHRDLKPSNVLIKWSKDARPHAILSDFDLAWFEGAISRTTTRIGDQAFASPEQLKEGNAGTQARAASDVYSLGMLLLFLISDRMPSAGQWYNQNLRRETFTVAERQFGWLRGANLFSDLVLRCAAERPSDRPTAGEVAQMLRKLHEVEKTNLAGLDVFIGEIQDRIAEIHPNQTGHSSIFHVEQRRNAGRVVIQASFSRELREFDDRGRFKPQGDRAVKTLRTQLETGEWHTQSSVTNEFAAKLVVSKEVKTASRDLALNIATQLSDGLDAWLKWQ